eukprot:778215-Pyramimonas_sp.AAC.1
MITREGKGGRLKREEGTWRGGRSWKGKEGGGDMRSGERGRGGQAGEETGAERARKGVDAQNHRK